ncbi:MAG: small nuclear ribonucleoprotein (Sm) [Vulcanisaeta sp.]|jgi:small nuclear ribonucleoprotein|nr:small nuclear ribonucleoprotein (Sm) [Vulcanisaeta sp.]MCG2870055.1 small nuclear ribonucleoprotein (Sm) [Vulcanisaeta sp.]MCG2879973.1 small nuclear ribonucleoprotein (Sm) [Vulcanisaeta sp.]MCG2887007.1 small nuclear ribonucleoprotein (Sm) [Vulcanisaeta sp.]MCG2892452.1 small nuclear ribonucleoprotein (Sm) [Vulcanisaeta sp.]
MERPQQPMKILQKMVGKRVVVRLKNNRVVRGVLVNYDDCMNLILDEGEEMDQRGENVVVKYGRLIIKGTQVLYITSEEAVG